MGKIPSAIRMVGAGPEDSVLGAMDDTNQARSPDTPGAFEMNGAMIRSATRKPGDDGIASGGGTGPGDAG